MNNNTNNNTNNNNAKEFLEKISNIKFGSVALASASEWEEKVKSNGVSFDAELEGGRVYYNYFIE